MHPFVQTIDRTWPRASWSDTRLLLAVSGGADSVSLLRAFLSLTADRRLLHVAHFNHCWRGDESEQDEHFVRGLGVEFGVKVFVSRADEIQGEAIERTEEAGREARYEFLSSVAYMTGARYVVTAHTASDRVETMLHNLFRGTGIAGVRSMAFFRPLGEELVVARPMLHCTRDQVIDYLEGIGQDFREDSSNEDQAYKRNFLRKTLLPVVREQYGVTVDEKLLSFSEIAAEIDVMLAKMATDYLTNAETMAREAFAAGGLDRLDRTMFAFPDLKRSPVHWPILRQALGYVWLDRKWSLGKMNRVHWEWIRSAHATSATFGAGTERKSEQVLQNLPDALQLVRNGDWLFIRKLE